MLKKYKGSGLVILALVGAAVVGVTSLTLAKANSVAVSSLKGNTIALQAQQYADAEAQLIKATAYNELSAKSKADIQNSNGFQSEVTLSEESNYSDTIKQKTATVNIYRTGETSPRVTLDVLKINKETSSHGGCQILTGTNSVSLTSNGNYKSLTLIASSKFIPSDSSWTGTAKFTIFVNGSSVGTLTNKSTTSKSGSRGHYWGTTEVVSNQVTILSNISQGDNISVLSTTLARHNTSTLTVILGS